MALVGSHISRGGQGEQTPEEPERSRFLKKTILAKGMSVNLALMKCKVR
jgi:hypothetical protein